MLWLTVQAPPAERLLSALKIAARPLSCGKASPGAQYFESVWGAYHLVDVLSGKRNIETFEGRSIRRPLQRSIVSHLHRRAAGGCALEHGDPIGQLKVH